jgi:ubiquinone/menaquinone biosynthesis C-methylase UbiE
MLGLLRQTAPSGDFEDGGQGMFREIDRKKCEQLLDKYYAGRKFSRTQYRELIHKYVSPSHRLLDAGCGRYLEFSKELADNVQVVGVDLEPALETRNQRSPYGVRGNLDYLPFTDNYFDLVISRSVIEHLANPSLVFKEFHRVLKPGGRVILSTPNKYDYVSIVAALTPYRWHRVLASKTLQVSEDDVFPTLYRANTLSKLGEELRAAGFIENELKAINHYPAYLMFSPVLFRLGILYERLIELHALRNLRGTLLAVFEKQSPGRVPERTPGKTERRAEENTLSSVHT